MSGETFIQTVSGIEFNFDGFTSNDIRVTDVARALSRLCRFNGHVSDFYSVGEHSIRVALAVWENTRDVELAYWGLLHDAAEAYVGDVTSPLKNFLRGQGSVAFDKLEFDIMGEVKLAFGLIGREPGLVKLYDLRLCATEARDLMLKPETNWLANMPDPLTEKITPIASMEEVEQLFLDVYAVVRAGDVGKLDDMVSSAKQRALALAKGDSDV